MTTPAFGAYLHVPFCAARCDYCAFATWTDRHHLRRYLEACRTDIERQRGRRDAGGHVRLRRRRHALAGRPRRRWPAVVAPIPQAPGAEVTVECNPDDVTPELLAAFAAGGVTRIASACSRWSPHVLAALGRTHDPRQRSPGPWRAAGRRHPDVQPRPDLRRRRGSRSPTGRATLDGAVALGPPHVSAYALTVEPGTALADDPARHPDDDDQADKYLHGGRRRWRPPGSAGTRSPTGPAPATSAGTTSCTGRWASTSRSAAPPTATATAGGSGTSARPSATSTRSRQGRSPEAAGERLDADRAPRVEACSCRCAPRRRARPTPSPTTTVDALDGLVEVDGDRVVLTRRGRLLANEVALRLELARAAPAGAPDPRCRPTSGGRSEASARVAATRSSRSGTLDLRSGDPLGFPGYARPARRARGGRVGADRPHRAPRARRGPTSTSLGGSMGVVRRREGRAGLRPGHRARPAGRRA